MARAAAQSAYGEVYRGLSLAGCHSGFIPGEYSAGPRASMGNRMTTLLERTPTPGTTDYRINLRQPINRAMP
jgi:hypothetical protein